MSRIFCNEMKYKQEETLYLLLQEDCSLFLSRKRCPRSWRTYCTTGFQAGESSFECSESGQEQCSVASRVALIQCREQAQQFRLLLTNRAMTSLNFRWGPWHSVFSACTNFKPLCTKQRIMRYKATVFRQTRKTGGRSKNFENTAILIRLVVIPRLRSP